MAIFKCKMCGGTLEINPGESVATCEYCGSQQTLPKLDDDRKENLYDRANHFRRNNEFDKAAGIYEQILNEDNTDAEAYWSIVLCRYGIEYVEDPTTHKRVPTVNRAQYTSIFDDENYKSAIEHADKNQRTVYEKEAKIINKIQKGILAISQKEEPFDVFICYKETDNSGRRTRDSVLANDLYHELTREGFKVFFSRITLEDKLGTAYEPYIFAALNSAKVMVVLGTKPEYFNAVWVKNEWSRYLALIKNGDKKTLVPAYKDMDPYDLPEEFSHLQALDMSKLGFMQDLIRGIKKLIGSDKSKTTVVKEVTVGANIAPLLKRVSLFLEDGNWTKADDFCEQVLNIDPENAEAYVGKLMAELKVNRRQNLKKCAQPFDTNNNCQKAFRFGDEPLKNELNGYLDAIRSRNREEQRRQESKRREEQRRQEEARRKKEENRKESIYTKAVEMMKTASNEEDYLSAAKEFAGIKGHKDATALNIHCMEKAEICRKDTLLAKAKEKMQTDTFVGYMEAAEALRSISGWKDADELALICNSKIEDLTEKEKQELLRKEEEEKAAAKKKKKRIITFGSIAAAVVAVCIAFVIVLNTVIIPNDKYNSAVEIYNAGKYDEAIAAFKGLNGYKDSEEQITKCEKAKLKAAVAGDVVCFGTYEQDNDNSNGKEDIEWLVLAKEENKAFVISRYAIDCQQYKTSSGYVTWETCSLRKWLNGLFVSTAFNSEEQNSIISSTVTADKNPLYGTSPGNNTIDKVFLLSITEVNDFFSSDSARQCQGTAYCYAQGTQKNKDGNCYWWLRSPGSTLNSPAANVSFDGSINYSGNVVYSDCIAVRPSLWINLGS